MPTTPGILTLLLTLLLAAQPLVAQPMPAPAQPDAAATTDTTTPARKDLTVMILPVVPMGRTSAPSPVVAEFTYNRNGLMRGRLELTASENLTTPFILVTHDLVLATGDTRLPLHLPPIPGAFFNTSIIARGTFVTDDGQRIDLGEHVLPIANEQQRTLAIAVSDPFSSQRLYTVLESLQLEGYRPDRENRLMQTGLVRLKPGAVPTTPEALLAYDMLVLADEGLSFLEANQLDAIANWVRTGGRVLVIPGPNMQTQHLAFINQLAGHTRFAPQPVESDTAVMAIDGDPASDDMPVTINVGPRNAPAAQPGPLFDRYRVGLGRAVVLHGLNSDQIEPQLKSPDWRRVVSFLWHVRDAQQTPLQQAGTWSEPEATVESLLERGILALPSGQTWEQMSAEERQDYAQSWSVQNALRVHEAGHGNYGVQPAEVGDAVVQHLMPDTVRFVPMWVIWVALGALVLVIGPVDYVLLGAIRQRKWTWLVFPLVTIAFTLGLLQISRWYLGETTSRKALIVRDIGADGTVLRETRFELWFAGGSGMREADIEDGYFAPLNHRRFASGMQWNNWQYEAGTEPVRYLGRVPGDYQVQQMLGRWTPQLNRRTTLLPDLEPIDVDWELASPESLVGDQLRAMLQQQKQDKTPAEIISEQLGKPVQVYTFHGTQMLASSSQEGGQHLPTLVQTHYHTAPIPQALQQLTDRPHQGLFNIVATIAPTAGPNFEDLAILDSSDPLQFAILIVTQDGDDTIVYRRVFHRKGNPS